MAEDRKIYTWRGLPYWDRMIDLVWWWSGWEHAMRDRHHYQEAARLWGRAFSPELIDPVIAALEHQQSLEECRSALQRLAEDWKGAFEEVFGMPRVMECRAVPEHAPASRGRRVLQFVTDAGLIFIARQQGNSAFRLATYYFPKTLVDGLSLFREGFVRMALEAIVEDYTNTEPPKLPDPDNPQHFRHRRHENDHTIRFHIPEHWGFANDQPGAAWLGVTHHPEETDTDGPISPPFYDTMEDEP